MHYSFMTKSDSGKKLSERLQWSLTKKVPYFNSLCEKVVVNYGIFGPERNRWLGTDHTISDCAVINKTWAGNKLDCVQRLNNIVPTFKSYDSESVNSVDRSVLEHWIIKPLLSEGGANIGIWDGIVIPPSMYIQERSKHRVYELRVHAFTWVPKEQWLVAKKTHPGGNNALTWNHATGGRFANIELVESNTGVFARAKMLAEKALKTLGYQFGAVDFIVERPPGHRGELPLYFLEVNTQPGFSTESTEETYVEAFAKLESLSWRQVKELAGMTEPQPERDTSESTQRHTSPTGGVIQRIEHILQSVEMARTGDIPLRVLNTKLMEAATELQQLLTVLRG